MTTARTTAAMDDLVQHQVEYILKGNPTPIEIEQCIWNAIESGFCLGRSVGFFEGAATQLIENAKGAKRGDQL